MSCRVQAGVDDSVVVDGLGNLLSLPRAKALTTKLTTLESFLKSKGYLEESTLRAHRPVTVASNPTLSRRSQGIGGLRRPILFDLWS